MKQLQTVLAISILLTFLQFSASSQTITVTSEKICFDTLAAQQIVDDYEVREAIINLYVDELTRCDSIRNISELKYYACNDSLQYWQGKYHKDIKQVKKEKRTWLWSFIGMSAIAFLFGVN